MKNRHYISKYELRKIVLEELRDIKKQQLLKEQLNEGLWDTITGFFGTMGNAVTDRIKGAMCDALISRFGVSREDFFGQVICNVFEEMEISEWISVFSGDTSRCQILAQNLLEAIAESLAERTADAALDIDENSWLYQAIGAPTQEAIQNSIIRNSELTRTVGQAICELLGDAGNILQTAGIPEPQSNSLISSITSLFSGGSSPAAAAAAPAASR